MHAITSSQYAAIANRVYGINKTAGHIVAPFESTLFEEGKSWGGKIKNGFRGCTYANKAMKEVVVAFQGTKATSVQDLLADLKLVLGILPNQCSSAFRLLQRTAESYPGYAISLTGHSLGGGLAQVVGHWSGLPFCTFNAPGMWQVLQIAKINITAPQKAWRSIKGTAKGSLAAKQKAATGRNFRNVMDPVSGFGSHYGPVTRFWNCKGHSMDSVEDAVRNSGWASLCPIDPSNKEWGEL